MLLRIFLLFSMMVPSFAFDSEELMVSCKYLFYLLSFILFTNSVDFPRRMKMEKIQSFPEVRLSTSLPRYLFQEQIFSDERRYLKTRALYGKYDLAFLEWYLVTVLSLIVVEDSVFLSLHKAVRKEPGDSSHLSPPPVVVTHLLTNHPDELQIMGSRLENNVWWHDGFFLDIQLSNYH